MYSGCATAMDAQARVMQKNSRLNCRSSATSFLVIQSKFFLKLLIVLLDLHRYFAKPWSSHPSVHSSAKLLLAFASAPSFRWIRSTATEMQSMSENDFQCFASTGVNTPVTMLPDSVLQIFDFPKTYFRPRSTALGYGPAPSSRNRALCVYFSHSS